jgi:hypothetical protein
VSNITKQVIGLLMVTTLAFLILTHAAGFARSVSATGQSFAVVAKTLQGR